MNREATKIQKRDTRRVLWLIGVAILGVVAMCAYRFFVDEPPVDDAAFLGDLAAMPAPAPNPLAEFQDWLDANPAPARVVAILRSHGTAGISSLMHAASLPRRQLTEGDRQEVLRLTDAHLKQLKHLLASDPGEWRWRAVHAGMSCGSPGFSPAGLDVLPDVLGARAEVYALRNDHRLALEEAMLLERLGRLAALPTGNLLHSSAATNLQAEGRTRVRESLLAMSRLTASDLAAIQAQWQPETQRPQEHIPRALRLDYLAMRNSLRDSPAKDLRTGSTASPLDRLLKRNATTRLMLESHQVFSKSAGKDWATFRREAEVICHARSCACCRPITIGEVMDGNFAGRDLWIMTTDVARFVVQHAFEAAARHNITLLQFATRRFELANGRLPARIEELTPDLISEIPNDPFDGGKIKWALAGQAIYSSGENGLDDGGIIDPNSPCRSGKADYGETYWWKPPATGGSRK